MANEDLLLRSMPRSLEGEQAVLGSMLIDPDCVGASNFLKAYRTQTAREREYNALSPDVRAIVAELAAAKAMPELSERKSEASSAPDGGMTKRPERIRDMAQALREGRTPDESGGKEGAHDGE